MTSRTGSTFNIPQLSHLKNYFKVEVLYEETKNHKPHPEPLLLAAQKLGIPPSECVYIGDSESDMIAAKDAGMRRIAYSTQIFPDAEAQISSFEELSEIIANL